MLQKKAANKNTYAEVDTYEKMIESIKATETEGTERKVATIIQMINQRKAVSDAQAKEKVTYESHERTRYGFENYETRMEACIEMIRDGNPSSVRTLIGIIKQGPRREDSRIDKEKFKKLSKRTLFGGQ